MTEDDGARPTSAGRPSVLCSDVGLCPMLPSFTTKVKSDVGPRPERGLRRRGPTSVICPLRPCGAAWAPGSTWWSQRGGPTRPHSELGRETPLRPGYCPTKGWESGSPPGRASSPRAAGRCQTSDIRRQRADDRDRSSARPSGLPATSQLAAPALTLILARHDSLPDP